MKIINIRTQTLKAPLKNPFITSLRRVDALEDLVVIVECDDGSVGYGEGAPTPVITGETMGSMIAAIEYIKPFIIGFEIENFNLILNNIHTKILKNTTAKSALEIALYDLKAKAAKQEKKEATEKYQKKQEKKKQKQIAKDAKKAEKGKK